MVAAVGWLHGDREKQASQWRCQVRNYIYDPEFRGELWVSVVNVKVISKPMVDKVLGAGLSHREIIEGEKRGQD